MSMVACVNEVERLRSYLRAKSFDATMVRSIALVTEQRILLARDEGKTEHSGKVERYSYVRTCVLFSA